MGVMLYHIWLLQVDAPKWSEPLGIGWLGVQLFFVLSGLVLFLPYAGGERRLALSRYAAARVLRIVPAFWVVLIVVPFALHTPDRAASAVILSAVFLVWGLVSRRWSAWLGFALTAAAAGRLITHDGIGSLRHLKDYAFLQYNDVTALVPQGWTLSLEVGFYVLLPLVVFAAAVRPVLRLPLIGILIAIGLYWRLFSGLPLTPLSFVDQFAYGMLAAVAVRSGIARRAWIPLIGAAIVIASMFTGPVNRHWLPTSTLFAVGCAFILAWLAARNPSVRLRPLVWLGTISYGIYLWHYLVITWIDENGYDGRSIVLRGAIVIPVTLLLATLSWLLVEKTLLQRRIALTSFIARASYAMHRRAAPQEVAPPSSVQRSARGFLR